LGATDEQIADFFGVSVPTIDNWKKAHPAFLGALKESKAALDTKVERSLYERAMGYSHPAVKILTVAGQVEQVPYVERYPPDTTAMIFWLKNRKPAEWRDRQEITGKDGTALVPPSTAINLAGATPEQLRALASLQLPDGDTP
jgi:hypothetical protein